MRYMLLIYGDESGWGSLSEADQQTEMAKWYAYTEEMQKAGVSTQGDALQPSSTATSVRSKDGETIVTDGPFAETKEQLGGYYLLECESREQAVDFAKRIPGARRGRVEVRPVVEYEAPEWVEKALASHSS